MDKGWVQLNDLHLETKSTQGTPLTPGATENSMFYDDTPEITFGHTTELELLLNANVSQSVKSSA